MNKHTKAGNSAITLKAVEGKSYFWRSFGKSLKQLFCEGSHKGTEFKPITFKADATKKNFFVLVNKPKISHFVKDLITNKWKTYLVN